MLKQYWINALNIISNVFKIQLHNCHWQVKYPLGKWIFWIYKHWSEVQIPSRGREPSAHVVQKQVIYVAYKINIETP